METNKVFQGNVFIREKNFMGQIEEVTLPGPTSARVEHATISSLGTLNLHSGFDLMEGRFKWKAMSESIEDVAADVINQVSVQVRFDLVKFAGSPRAVHQKVLYVLKIRFRNAPGAELTPKSDVDSESMFDIDYIRKEINGVSKYEFDPVNFIYKVNGVDMLADVRANLGIA